MVMCVYDGKIYRTKKLNRVVKFASLQGSR